MTNIIELPEWDLVAHANKITSNSAAPKLQLSVLWGIYTTIWTKCEACNDIYTDRKVFGAGDLNADVMIIGEGPGEDEELQLKPFVGAAGKILNIGLRNCGVTREDLYITNSVLCRCTKATESGKISNRPPVEEEMAACLPRLEAEIGLVSPKMIIIMGNSAWKTISKRSDPIGTITNKEFELVYSSWDGTRKSAVLIPTYHTAALLYSSGNPKKLQEMKYAIGDTFQTIEKFVEEQSKAKIEAEAAVK